MGPIIAVGLILQEAVLARVGLQPPARVTASVGVSSIPEERVRSVSATES